ncbi:MAG: transporter ATP-binding protein [Caulobacter sp.]|nr:transporter ATP-binding protein [Caulobacter sp.]
MARVRLDRLSKRFGAVPVLDDISLDIAAGEFVAFLGPSGCGKSTLLRMIAGLESVDAGQIHIGDRRVDQLPPGGRGVAMVFQHYALYPHMTIFENMAFGLRNAKVAKAEIEARVAEAARILEIERFLPSKPGQLSGGQRQRVAIGRAIVKKPDLFLFDEPLSNLDAALRLRTRLELAQLRRRLDATMILVTHDQVEAMTLADRIVVMSDRRIQQIGTPMEIYARPANRFVATFVGSPPMAFLDVTLNVGADGLARAALADGAGVQTAMPLADLPSSPTWRLGVRPEAAKVVAPGTGLVDAKIAFVERLGDRTLVHLRLADGGALTAEDAGTSRAAMDDIVGLAIDGPVHLFDAEDNAHHPRAPT